MQKFYKVLKENNEGIIGAHQHICRSLLHCLGAVCTTTHIIQCSHPEIQNKTTSKMFFAQKFNIKLLHRCFFFKFRLPRRCFHETYIKGKSNPNNIFEIISSNAKCQGYPKQFIKIPKMYYFLLSAILCHHCIVFCIVALSFIFVSFKTELKSK